MKHLKFLIILCLTLQLFSCVEATNGFNSLPPGIWRASLDITPPSYQVMKEAKESNNELDELTRGDFIELPFTFEIVYEKDVLKELVILNGEERLVVDDVKVWRDPETARDSVLIDFPLYDSYIAGVFRENKMEGDWHVKSKKNYSIPFQAYHGQGHRFTQLKKTPKLDLSGKWKTTFSYDEKDPYPALAEFKQVGNKLTGTFRTETGDYRYLEGTVQADKFYLSTFDGSHAFQFEGKILEDNSLVGVFRSGKHYQANWIAEKDESFRLQNPSELTKKVHDFPIKDLKFKDINGELVSLINPDSKSNGTLVSIIGTWCPNCRDETNFLKEFHESADASGIDIVAVAFERYDEFELAAAGLKRYKEKMGFEYPLLYGGKASKALATEKFPMLDKIISFPTLLFVNKQGEIVKVHTGFNGPATSVFEEFKKDFLSMIKEIKE